MYILASKVFEYDDKYYLKLDICVVCRKLLTFEYVFIVFVRNKSEDYLYLYIRNLENSRLEPFFSVHNIHLYLCWQVEDTKWILCCRKTDVKCAYLRFLMYKSFFPSYMKDKLSSK